MLTGQAELERAIDEAVLLATETSDETEGDREPRGVCAILFSDDLVAVVAVAVVVGLAVVTRGGRKFLVGRLYS